MDPPFQQCPPPFPISEAPREMDSCLPYTPVAGRNWDRMGSFLTGSERERGRQRERAFPAALCWFSWRLGQETELGNSPCRLRTVFLTSRTMQQ